MVKDIKLPIVEDPGWGKRGKEFKRLSGEQTSAQGEVDNLVQYAHGLEGAVGREREGRRSAEGNFRSLESELHCARVDILGYQNLIQEQAKQFSETSAGQRIAELEAEKASNAEQLAGLRNEIVRMAPIENYLNSQLEQAVNTDPVLSTNDRSFLRGAAEVILKSYKTLNTEEEKVAIKNAQLILGSSKLYEAAQKTALDKGLITEAYEHFVEAVKIDWSLGSRLEEIAEHYTNTDHKEIALAPTLALLEAAFAVDPDNDKLVTYKYNFYVAAIRRAQTESLMKIGLNDNLLGDYIKLVNKFEKYIENAAQGGNLSAAAKWVKRLVELDPVGNHEVEYQKALKTLAEERNQNILKGEPAAKLEKTLDELDSSYNRQVLADFGRSLEKEGKLEEAQMAFQYAHNHYPDADEKKNLVRINTTLGKNHYNAGNLAQAVSVLQQALELEPGNIDARYFLATAYEQQGELGSAIKEYGKVLDDKQEHRSAKEGISRIEKNIVPQIKELRDQGQYNRAREYCQVLQEINPASFEAQYLAGTIEERSGKFEEAETLYKAALGIRDSTWAKKGLKRIAKMSKL